MFRGVKIIDYTDPSTSESDEDDSELECVKLLKHREKKIIDVPDNCKIRYISIEAPSLSPLIQFSTEKTLGEFQCHRPVYIIRLLISNSYSIHNGGAGFTFMSRIYHPTFQKGWTFPVHPNLTLVRLIKGIRSALLNPSWKLPLFLMHNRFANRLPWRTMSNPNHASSSVYPSHQSPNKVAFKINKKIDDDLNTKTSVVFNNGGFNILSYAQQVDGPRMQVPSKVAGEDLSQGNNAAQQADEAMENGDSLGSFILNLNEFKLMKLERDRLFSSDLQSISRVLPSRARNAAMNKLILKQNQSHCIDNFKINSECGNHEDDEKQLKAESIGDNFNDYIEDNPFMNCQLDLKNILHSERSNINTKSTKNLKNSETEEEENNYFANSGNNFTAENNQNETESISQIESDNAQSEDQNRDEEIELENLQYTSSGLNPFSTIFPEANSLYFNLNSSVNHALTVQKRLYQLQDRQNQPENPTHMITSPTSPKKSFHERSPRFLRNLSVMMNEKDKNRNQVQELIDDFNGRPNYNGNFLKSEQNVNSKCSSVEDYPEPFNSGVNALFNLKKKADCKLKLDLKNDFNHQVLNPSYIFHLQKVAMTAFNLRYDVDDNEIICKYASKFEEAEATRASSIFANTCFLLFNSIYDCKNQISLDKHYHLQSLTNDCKWLDSADERAYQLLKNRLLLQRKTLHERVYGGGEIQMSGKSLADTSAVGMINVGDDFCAIKKQMKPIALSPIGLKMHPIVQLSNAVCDAKDLLKFEVIEHARIKHKIDLEIDVKESNETKETSRHLDVKTPLKKPKRNIKLSDLYSKVRYINSIRIDSHSKQSHFASAD